MKKFNEMSNIGQAKYVVNFHDGITTHRDGSPFYDIRIFSNKKIKNGFIRQLKQEGYVWS